MENSITHEDELRAESEVLKLKLELEQGMLYSDTSQLSADMEKQWLNYIYNYEQTCKDAGKIKLIDFVGNPSFRQISDVPENELEYELDKLLEFLFTKDVKVNFICEYSDEVKYHFITEELFQEEFYNIKLEGTILCFTYEEFHPNHDYDLKRHSEYFLETILNQAWTEDHAKYEMTDVIRFQNKEVSKHDITQVIFSFYDEVKRLELRYQTLKEVVFNMDENVGSVKVILEYSQYWNDGSIVEHNGEGVLYFEYEFGGWSLSGFSLPGLG